MKRLERLEASSGALAIGGGVLKTENAALKKLKPAMLEAHGARQIRRP